METLLNPFRGKPTYMSPRVKGYTDIQCICHPNLYGYTDTCRLGYLYQKSTFFRARVKILFTSKRVNAGPSHQRNKTKITASLQSLCQLLQDIWIRTVSHSNVW